MSLRASAEWRSWVVGRPDGRTVARLEAEVSVDSELAHKGAAAFHCGRPWVELEDESRRIGTRIIGGPNGHDFVAILPVDTRRDA